MNKDDITKAKAISIERYLESTGYRAVKGRSSGKYLVYSSMLHDESVPSFFVDKNRNTWKDFGMPGTKWDDVISLVQLLENVSFPKALERLLNKEFVNCRTVIQTESKAGLEIVDIFPLRNPKLFAYLVGRNVDLDLAKMYCQEALVTFPLKNPKKKHSYIAFKNDKGGYELRNHYDIQIKKVSSRPKYFTRLKGIPLKYNLFEGFIDFLSMLKQYKTESFKNTTVVLNSLVNIFYLYETLKANEENNLFINNDEPADKYIFKGDSKLKIKSLKELGISYNDQRNLFNANDINDYINGKIFI